jgi:prevent-host-death family protein
MRMCKQCGGIGGIHKSACSYTQDIFNVGSVLDAVIDEGEEFIVSRQGKPAAMLLPYDRYQDLLTELNKTNDQRRT